MTELQLQSSCFQWAWNTYPELRRLLFAVPNGGRRDAREAMNLKASGVVAGVLDMVLYWKFQLYGFEFKVGSNGLTQDQAQTIVKWQAQGAICYVIREEDQFKGIITKIMSEKGLLERAIDLLRRWLKVTPRTMEHVDTEIFINRLNQ